MKENELRLICELMKDSRRSDRELAKAVGVSQPTISRMMNKLEKEGIIREYTIVPDFSKLGFGIMSVEFIRLKEPIPEEKLEKIREQVRQTLWKDPMSMIAGMSGIGLNADRIVIAFHEDYSAYTEHLKKIRDHPLARADQIATFLVDLNDKNQYLLPTLSTLADYITYKKLKRK